MKILSIILFYGTLILGIGTHNPLLGTWSDPIDLGLPDSEHPSAVGIDPSGNAIIHSNNVDGADHPLAILVSTNGSVGTEYDISPVAGSLINGTASISVNASGDAALTWGETIGGHPTLKTATITGGTLNSISNLTDNSLWDVTSFPKHGVNLADDGTPISISIVQNISDPSTYEVQSGGGALLISGVLVDKIAVAGNPTGRNFALWIYNNTVLSGAIYDGENWIWLETISDSVYGECEPPSPAVAMSPTNEVMFLWKYSNADSGLQEIHSKTYLDGTFGTEKTVYAPAAGEEIVALAVAIDRFGNAIALWISADSGNYSLQGNRFTNGSWGTAFTLDTALSPGTIRTPPITTTPNIAMDDYGNAYAVWQKNDDSGNGFIYASYYAAPTGTISSPTLISSESDSSLTPDLAMNGVGNAVAVWRTFDSIAKVSQTRNPTTAQSFTGSQVSNQFLFQNELVNVLNWTASTDTSVTQYFIYRDYAYVTTVPSTSILRYEDHGRAKGTTNTYHLVAADVSNIQSAPLSVTL